MLGTFTPLQKIFLSSKFLNTLELSELKSGVGEMLKVHAIAGPSDFQSITNDFEDLFSNSDLMMKRI